MSEEHGAKRRKVAYLGPPASYTHEATASTFPPPHNALLPKPSIPSVFHAVQSGEADTGVVPFENSTNGSVTQTLDLLVDRHNAIPDVRVCGDAFVRVRHCLLGRRREGDNSPDGEADLSHVTTVRTHPQAWTQCTSFLEGKLAGAKRYDAASTSEAAATVSKDDSGTSASISNALAAQLYGLDVLAAGIEDVQGNTTRFLVLERAGSERVESTQQTRSKVVKFKTLLLFTIPHDAPGALAAALGVFGRHGINLTSINARPSGERNWHYVFFVEFTGGRSGPSPAAADAEGGQMVATGAGADAMIRQRQDISEDDAVVKALKELEGCVKSWRWLGCWPEKGEEV